VNAGFKQMDVTTELVHSEAMDAKLFVWIQQLNRAKQRGEDAAAINITNK